MLEKIFKQKLHGAVKYTEPKIHGEQFHRARKYTECIFTVPNFTDTNTRNQVRKPYLFLILSAHFVNILPTFYIQDPYSLFLNILHTFSTLGTLPNYTIFRSLEAKDQTGPDIDPVEFLDAAVIFVTGGIRLDLTWLDLA